MASHADQVRHSDTFTKSFRLQYCSTDWALKLPGESTLRDYTNAVHPQDGFNGDIVQEVKKATASLKAHQRWVVLLHEEMAIKSDLIHDVVTGQVVGFVNNSDWSTTSPTESDLASHVLVFMVVGVNSHLNTSLGYFPTKAATPVFLYQTFWRAVGYCFTQSIAIVRARAIRGGAAHVSERKIPDKQSILL